MEHGLVGTEADETRVHSLSSSSEANAPGMPIESNGGMHSESRRIIRHPSHANVSVVIVMP